MPRGIRMQSFWLPVMTVVLGVGVAAVRADVRPHAGMLRYPDVSATHIVFTFANDLWIVPREGGLATPLASPKGVEAFARFSNDGQTIAFMGDYEGNVDIYTIPITGGVPFRVTHHPMTEQINGWSPDGRILFQANGIEDYERPQIFIVGAEGGLPERLPVPYGGNAAISPDGTWLAYTPYVRDNRTWKRYRGGRAADIWLFNLQDHSAKRITDWEGTDSIPMWQGDKIYFLSDAGPHARLNIWVYDTQTGKREQVTDFSEYDVKWPSIGPGPNGQGEIVFQNGSALYLLDLATGKSHAVEVTIPGDRPTLLPQRVDVSKYIRGADVSATGKRAVVEARGDIWTLPAKEGIPRNLTRTSGVAERDPSWSPDGRWIAYFSDADGENDLYLTQSDGKGETRKLAALGPGYRWMRTWSPDSKYVSFADETGALYLCEIETGTLTQVDVDPGARGPGASWSNDSRWIAYARTGDNDQTAVWLYNVETGEKHQVTSGFFHDTWPVFDRKGDWLYCASNRSFESPIYEDIGKSFVYTGTDVLLAIPLRKDVKYPWIEKSDEEKWDKDDKKKDGDKKDGDKPEDEKKDEQDAAPKKDEPAGEEKKADEPKAEPATDDGVSGTWEGSISGSDQLPPEGLTLTLTLNVAEDGAVGGSLVAGPYHGTITGGKYERETGALSFNLDVQTDEGMKPFSATATITGQEMSGTVNGEDFAASFTAKRTGTGAAAEEETKEEKPKEETKKVEIEIEGFEARAIQLPVGRGAFSHLAVNDKNQLIYLRRGGNGSGDAPEIKLFDLEDEKKEEKSVASGAGAFTITPDGKKLFVFVGGRFAIIDAKPGQKLNDKVPVDGMVAIINPREEWAEVFTDAWRIYRDFFYVQNMHGVDWPAVREEYGKMLADCISREDVAYVLSEMMSELNVGHAYYYGRPTDVGPRVSVGLLGADFELHDGAYRIRKIYKGGAWDVDARGPLVGTDIKEGEYLLAVNGIPLDTTQDPWAAFQGLAGDATTLTISAKPTLDDDAREVIVRPVGGEGDLRYRSWVEGNRKYVEEKTNGRVGYIHVPDTGVNGQNNLFRQFYGQRDKAALIIDERWNHGGQIPIRFIELLNRPLMNYWANRHGRDGRTPEDAQFGPKCMLINESAGSGGDMFPKLFRQVGLGKLIGVRTWGGLVGMAGNPGLIDGQYVTVPMFGYYDKDGTWGIEGHGVDPDIVVMDDPALMQNGADPQLDAAIAEMQKELEHNAFVPAQRPADPVRTGVGIREEDK